MTPKVIEEAAALHGHRLTQCSDNCQLDPSYENSCYRWEDERQSQILPGKEG